MLFLVLPLDFADCLGPLLEFFVPNKFICRIFFSILWFRVKIKGRVNLILGRRDPLPGVKEVEELLRAP